MDLASVPKGLDKWPEQVSEVPSETRAAGPR